MQYFKTPDGTVYAFEDDYAGPLVTPEMVPMTQADIEAHLNPIPLWAKVQASILQTAREYREKVITRLMDIASEYNWDGDAVNRDLCRAARRSLLDITQDARVVAASNEAELKAALVMRYAEIRATLSPSVRDAFSAVDA